MLNNFPAPVVCVCQGKSLGGGFGLVCCCDYRIGITNTDCQFSLSEVKLGLAPAVIVPYLIDTLGPRLTRRFCLTAEVINDSFALELRLLDECISAAQLDIRLSELRRTFEHHGTTAMAAGKLLINSQKHFTSQQQRLDACVQTIARLRVSPQGQEGCRAFLEKRPPRW